MKNVSRLLFISILLCSSLLTFSCKKKVIYKTKDDNKTLLSEKLLKAAKDPNTGLNGTYVLFTHTYMGTGKDKGEETITTDNSACPVNYKFSWTDDNLLHISFVKFHVGRMPFIISYDTYCEVSPISAKEASDYHLPINSSFKFEARGGDLILEDAYSHVQQNISTPNGGVLGYFNLEKRTVQLYIDFSYYTVSAMVNPQVLDPSLNSRFEKLKQIFNEKHEQAKFNQAQKDPASGRMRLNATDYAKFISELSHFKFSLSEIIFKSPAMSDKSKPQRVDTVKNIASPYNILNLKFTQDKDSHGLAALDMASVQSPVFESNSIPIRIDNISCGNIPVCYDRNYKSGGDLLVYVRTGLSDIKSNVSIFDSRVNKIINPQFVDVYLYMNVSKNTASLILSYRTDAKAKNYYAATLVLKGIYQK